jgi:hypothetical protein
VSHTWILCIEIPCSCLLVFCTHICRCMALSTVIFVGESKNWLPEIVEKARHLKCGSGLDPTTEVRRVLLWCMACILSGFCLLSF